MKKTNSYPYLLLLALLFLNSCRATKKEKSKQHVEIINRIDTLLFTQQERKLWQLDATGTIGYRSKLYSEIVKERSKDIIGLSAQEVHTIFGPPDDKEPNIGISPALEPADEKFTYSIYDQRFRVFHRYNLFLKKDTVIQLKFRRGAY